MRYIISICNVILIRFFMGAYGILYDLSWRLWLYYYDICWNIEIDHDDLNALINDCQERDMSNYWFMRHKGTLGMSVFFCDFL